MCVECVDCKNKAAGGRRNLHIRSTGSSCLCGGEGVTDEISNSLEAETASEPKRDIAAVAGETRTSDQLGLLACVVVRG